MSTERSKVPSTRSPWRPRVDRRRELGLGPIRPSNQGSDDSTRVPTSCRRADRQRPPSVSSRNRLLRQQGRTSTVAGPPPHTGPARKRSDTPSETLGRNPYPGRDTRGGVPRTPPATGTNVPPTTVVSAYRRRRWCTSWGVSQVPEGLDESLRTWSDSPRVTGQ